MTGLVAPACEARPEPTPAGLVHTDAARHLTSVSFSTRVVSPIPTLQK